MGFYMFFDFDVLCYNIGFGFLFIWVVIGIIMVLVVEVVYKWGNMKKEKINEDEVWVRYI